MSVTSSSLLLNMQCVSPRDLSVQSFPHLRLAPLNLKPFLILLCHLASPLRMTFAYKIKLRVPRRVLYSRCLPHTNISHPSYTRALFNLKSFHLIFICHLVFQATCDIRLLKQSYRCHGRIFICTVFLLR